MKNENHSRIKSINKMLFEMAKGNFHYRMTRSSKKDHLEALSVTLNMLAEEMEEALIHQGYANLDSKLLQIVQMSLFVNLEGQIMGINQGSKLVLGKKPGRLLETSIYNLIDEQSKKHLIGAFNEYLMEGWTDKELELTFINSNDLEVPKTTYISKMDFETYPECFLITIIHHSKVDSELAKEMQQIILAKNSEFESNISKKESKRKIRLTYDDIRKIRHCRDFIMNNLEMDFPNLKDFALKIGTNEFKLKYGFKELYGTTVYRFILQERLRKAKMLIQHSDKSLKTISIITGFKSFPHFSRTFKKIFGYSPSDLRKGSIDI